MISDIEQQFNSEIEYSIACEELDVCLKAGDELTSFIDNVCQLQLVANRCQSREALSVISDLATGELASYSAENFFADAWTKIKKFFKWLWEKITAFFKWIWNKLKALFVSNKKIVVSSRSSLARLAEQDPKIAKYVEIKKSSNEVLETLPPQAQLGLIIGGIAVAGVSIAVIKHIFDTIADGINKRFEMLDKPVALSTIVTGDKFNRIESIESDFDTAMKVSSDKLEDIKSADFLNKLDTYEKSLMTDAKRKVYFTVYKFRDYTGNLIIHADKLKRVDDKVQKSLHDVNEVISKLASQNNNAEEVKGYLKVAQTKAKMANQFARVIADLNKRFVAACRVAQRAFPEFFSPDRIKLLSAANDPEPDSALSYYVEY